MNLPFTFNLRDASLDKGEEGPCLYDIEVELECELEWHEGEPDCLNIDAVIMDGKDILRSSDPIFQAIACRIIEAAQGDEQLISAAVEDEGAYQVSRGVGDPDAYWVREEWS